MPDADRLLIEHEYGIPVHSAYQSCEFLRIAYQCAHRAGFHVCTDQVAVRVVDASGRDVAPGGTGDILVSGLVNRATVLLNYRLGDRVTLASEPCACGSELPLLASIDGRSEDLLVRADGECVHEAVVLPRVYGTPGLRMAQVIQHAIDRVEVKAVIAADADGRRTEAALRECIRALLDAGNELQVEVTLTDAIAHEPSGKFKAVISACRPGLQRSREPIP